MTTIATDGKTMAGDGQEVDENTIIGFAVEKVYRLDDGGLYGAAGTSGDIEAAFQWLNNPEGKKPKLKDFGAIVLTPDGEVLYYGADLVAVPSEAPYSVGSGSAHALTAMDIGKSPREAIEWASKRDVWTGGTITEHSLKDG